MKTLWDSSVREDLARRLDRLKPETSALWGRMNASQMVVHVADWFKMATGQLPTASRKLPIRFTPLKQFIIYGPPFPKNVPTAPELLVRQCEDWDTECASLKETMNSFGGLPPGIELPGHPAFGRLSRRAWGVLGYRHMDHHFRQFGI